MEDWKTEKPDQQTDFQNQVTDNCYLPAELEASYSALLTREEFDSSEVLRPHSSIR